MKSCSFIILITIVVKSLSGQFAYLSPIPGSFYNNTKTSIIIREGDMFSGESVKKQFFHVSGENSGLHDFTIKLSKDHKTIIISPFETFSYNETVTVTIDKGLKCVSGEEPDGIIFLFHTGKSLPVGFIPETGFPQKSMHAGFPSIDIFNTPQSYDGQLFFYNISPFASQHDRFKTILNNDGSIVYADQQDNQGIGFIMQESGFISYLGNGQHMLMDTNYTVIDSFKCGNGYPTDWHEFQYFSNGHAVVVSYDNQTVDMSQVVAGGDTNAIVEGFVFQELDEDKNVVFQWRSWDHYQITDAINTDFTDHYFAYVHGNSVELMNDSNYLISARKMDEITKIDRNTGDIIWRMGGLNNEFTFINDSIRYSGQHDVRQIDNGNITVFDNGELHTIMVSKAKEYVIDENSKTAELVWSYMHPDSVIAKRMGSVQRLENGNTVICWGQMDSQGPHVTEVDSAGNIVFEMTILNNNNYIYRSGKYNWTFPYSVQYPDNKTVSISLFPNPAEDYLIINIDIPSSGSASVEIMNNKGQTILFRSIEMSVHGKNTVYLDTGNIEKGAYYVRVKGQSFSSVKKLIIL